MALNDVLGGVRGALAFLTRIPIPTDEDDWDQFRAFPVAFPLVAYFIGAITALPFFVGVPSATVAFVTAAIIAVVVSIYIVKFADAEGGAF